MVVEACSQTYGYGNNQVQDKMENKYKKVDSGLTCPRCNVEVRAIVNGYCEHCREDYYEKHKHMPQAKPMKKRGDWNTVDKFWEK